MKIRIIIEIEEKLENWNVETEAEMLSAIQSEIEYGDEYIDAVLESPGRKITLEVPK